MPARPTIRLMSLAAGVALAAAVPAGAVETQPVDPLASLHQNVTQGALRVKKEDGSVVACPLKHTDVRAEISGFIARVRVAQVFRNPMTEKIEAVYVFPLPHKAAVDDMTMVIGERRIVGVIKRRQYAREVYQEALRRGAAAALLEQERPNIFTQSVGNIEPGQEIRIEISYVDVLEYDMGEYAFHFPMVVGPRYIPGKATSRIPEVPEELKGKVGRLDERKVPQGEKPPTGTGWAPDTDRVPDASRITPPVLKPGHRTGHDISLSVVLDAGVPIRDLASPNHEVEINRDGPSRARVRILPADSIPNKDFRLTYAVVGEKPEMAVLAHTDPAGAAGYFMLMVQPREDDRLAKSPPRELSFLIDVSGSMRGDKTAKVREAMGHLLKLARPDDTLQVITFAGNSQKLFPAPVPCSQENVTKALKVTEGLRGSGGTEMLKGVRMAINDPIDPKRVRIVIMLTDGFIGNEAEIIEEVGRRCGDHVRFWCIGIGQSPNRMLVDGVARQGGGMGKVLGLGDDALPLTQEIMYRIHRAQLADVTIDWGGLHVWETYPARIPELWAGRPIVLFGRYEPGSGPTTITVYGKVEGEPAAWPLQVHLPVRHERHDVLSKVWARRKIEELMHTTYYAGSPEVEEAVTRVALDYRLMSQYTSFVAVDESQLARMAEPAEPPRRMLVPVPIPERAEYEGFFGSEVPAAEAEVIAAAGGTSTFASLRKAAPAPVAFFGGAPVRQLEAAARPGRAFSSGAYTGGGAWYARQAGRESRRRAHGLTGKPMGTNRRWAYADGSRARARPGSGGAALAGAKPPAAAGLVLMEPAAREDAKREAADLAFGQHFSRYVMAGAAEDLARQAGGALEAAGELRENGDLLTARARAAHAYLLDLAAMNSGRGGGQVAEKALAAIDEINQALLRHWTKDHKALQKRLDLVLRDVSLEEACAALAGAVGAKALPVRLVPGSAEDAAAVTRRREVRVTYLDLRGATVAQALDWLTRPERLTWWLAGGTVQVTSARRSPVASPWVYDVSLLALPSAREIGEIKDNKKRIEALQKDAKTFLKAVRRHLAAPDGAVVWYGPTQVLVFGDAERHRRAAKLFSDLADPKATFEGDLADLHETTSRRAETRKDALDRLGDVRERGRVAADLAACSWRLLAEAAAGRLDDEALAHLQVAWRQDAIAPLAANGAGALVLLRSAWALTAGADLLGNEDLAKLARRARTRAEPAAQHVLETLEKSPAADRAALALLYRALTVRGDVRDDALRLLVEKKPAELPPHVAAVRTLAAVLLSPGKNGDAEALGPLVMKGPEVLRGPDRVVLTAMACRRVGGEPWRTFRAEARPLLGGQALPGGVAVLVSRLARPEVTLVSAAK